jgi:hypothetical protein
MPDQASAILRVHSAGGATVQEIQSFLGALEYSYNSAYVFEVIIDWLIRDERFFREFGDFSLLGRRLYRLRTPNSPFLLQEINGSPDHRRAIVPAGSHLILKMVSIRSPGVWDFLGKLNPLEVLRLYLNDRHERRKDIRYREHAEAEKLRLENNLRQIEVFRQKLATLRELGVTDEELAPLKNRLLHKPLEGMAQYKTGD